jgi:hypothetical protein
LIDIIKKRWKPLTVNVEYEIVLSLPFPVGLKLRARATSRMEYQNPP